LTGPDRRAVDSLTARRTLRLTLAYDGTNFAGWQVQPDSPTVQGLLRDACARILGEPVKLTGASRTDAGVHALRQVASLATASSLAPARLARGLNALLPESIRVLVAEEAPAG
jgi:tRNA pseudouridine38-40 synthase